MTRVDNGIGDLVNLEMPIHGAPFLVLLIKTARHIGEPFGIVGAVGGLTADNRRCNGSSARIADNIVELRTRIVRVAQQGLQTGIRWSAVRLFSYGEGRIRTRDDWLAIPPRERYVVAQAHTKMRQVRHIVRWVESPENSPKVSAIHETE